MFRSCFKSPYRLRQASQIPSFYQYLNFLLLDYKSVCLTIPLSIIWRLEWLNARARVQVRMWWYMPISGVPMLMVQVANTALIEHIAFVIDDAKDDVDEDEDFR
ncbi:hypothetical protein EDD18DRAFT_1112171 [Armillaria luteobubalina]|uniref:Uncharacterized protein n=1 Tax=Armillaria luteobubalina TaxID=153913 RepID=A0AA39PHD2_9AGAR|nr:hypothetical protein EDD18DRAFT_1112171 [Armillaria luteobubalina]